MSLSKSKCQYSNNCLHFLKRVAPSFTLSVFCTIWLSIFITSFLSHVWHIKHRKFTIKISLVILELVFLCFLQLSKTFFFLCHFQLVRISQRVCSLQIPFQSSLTCSVWFGPKGASLGKAQSCSQILDQPEKLSKDKRSSLICVGIGVAETKS